MSGMSVPLDHPMAQQNRQELLWLLAHVADVGSVLEVGSCFGQTLRIVAAFSAFGSKIRSIDLGTLPDEAGQFAGHDTAGWLRMVIAGLRALGHDAQLHIGNSHSAEAVAWADKNGPYDFVFIDGDHTYEGVRADWLAYGPLGRIVGFHDIAHPACGVGRLWDEIKQSGVKTEEAACSDMGIGLVFQ